MPDMDPDPSWIILIIAIISLGFSVFAFITVLSRLA